MAKSTRRPNASPGQKPSALPKLSGAANASPGTTKIKAPIATSPDYTGTGPAGKPAPKPA
jgi:hypothetical protein